MVSTPLILKTSIPCINDLVTVPRALITFGVTLFFHVREVFQFSCTIHLFMLLFAYFQFYFVINRDFKFHKSASSHFFCCCWLLLSLVIRPKLRDPFVFQNPKEWCASHFLGRVLGCSYTIWSYGQISISCTIPCLSPCPPVMTSLIVFLC